MEKNPDQYYLEEIFWEYQRGKISEALIKLERLYPELKGISEKVTK